VWAWERVAAMAGLKPSIGKVYWSDKFVNINSTNFRYEPEPEDWKTRQLSVAQENDLLKSWEEHIDEVELPDGRSKYFWNPYVLTRYVNLGLMMGLGRSSVLTSTDAVADYGSLSSRQKELYNLCPDLKQANRPDGSEGISIRRWVMREFMKRNKALIKDCAGLPFNIPKELGGLGLMGTQSFEDRAIATAMIEGSIPNAPRPKPFKAVSMTKIHQSARDQLRAAGIDPAPFWVLEEEAEELPEDHISELYFWIVYCRPDLAVASEEKNAISLIRHNKKVWNWYHKRLFKEGASPRAFETIEPRVMVTPTILMTESNHTSGRE